MSKHTDWTSAARGLLAKMLQDKGCDEFDVSVVSGHEEQCPFGIAHDRRGAPYVVDASSAEVAGTLVSFSDEEGTCASAWIKKGAQSPVVGLGIDLVDISAFREQGRGDFLVHALLFDDEARLARELHPEDAPLGYAYAFGAKEATFKATSQPLRAWCRRHGRGLFFEVRDYALATDGTHEMGVRRAVDVFSALGIDRVELGHVMLGDLVFVVALALGASE